MKTKIGEEQIGFSVINFWGRKKKCKMTKQKPHTASLDENEKAFLKETHIHM